MDEKAIKFLKKSGLPPNLIENFKDQEIDYETLLLLKSEHIKQLVNTVGQQAKLEACIEAERMLNMEMNVGSLSNVNKTVQETNNSKTHSCPMTIETEHKSHQRKKICSSAINLDLKKLLSQSVAGESILSYYHNNSRLDFPQRKQLTNIVVDHMLVQSSLLKGVDFIMATEKILEEFTSECSETYFLPCTAGAGSQSSGKLVTRYRNVRHTLIKSGILEPNKKNKEKNVTFEGLVEDEEYEASKRWLKSHSDPWNIVLDKWQMTSAGRLHELFKYSSDSLTDVLDNWPSFKLPEGYKLIQIDFAELYSENADNFINGWERVSDALLDYMKRTLKDSSSKLLMESIISSEMKTYIVLKLLHTLVKPTIFTVNKRKWHPTVMDSQDSIFILVKDSSQIENVIQERKNKMLLLHSTLQPFLILIGDNLPSVKYQLLYFDNNFYKFRNFIIAFDVLFKLYHVLNVAYPLESSQFWLFIQKGIFKITTKHDKKTSNVYSLINDLNL